MAPPTAAPGLLRRRRRAILVTTLTLAVLAAGGATAALWPHQAAKHPQAITAAPTTPASPLPTPSAAESTPPAAHAPFGLPVIDYFTAPRGFPKDPTPESADVPTQGLHPTRALAVYDAPGGRPRGRLKPSISGLPVTVPIVEQKSGWFAVLLPTANRTIGWLPATGWITHTLPDHLVVHRRDHTLTWLRNGAVQATWTVATGTKSTPTPLGRTFVLGRTPTSGSLYAGIDALALGSVPDDPSSLSAGLREAHTGIHGWHDSSAFGRSSSNGCIRMPKAAQLTLLSHIAPGTVVTVTD